MFAKRTAKNQLTLPKAIAQKFEGVEYFQVSEEAGSIVLAPVRPSRAAEARAKLARLGISEADVAEAVAWSRRK
ncbi:MAG: AbrB/MazE/SpoVT family DNA-binding domain-containing protein [Acidobacteriota bacterium]